LFQYLDLLFHVRWFCLVTEPNMAPGAPAHIQLLQQLLKLQQMQMHAHLSLCMSVARILAASSPTSVPPVPPGNVSSPGPSPPVAPVAPPDVREPPVALQLAELIPYTSTEGTEFKKTESVNLHGNPEHARAWASAAWHPLPATTVVAHLGVSHKAKGNRAPKRKPSGLNAKSSKVCMHPVLPRDSGTDELGSDAELEVLVERMRDYFNDDGAALVEALSPEALRVYRQQLDREDEADRHDNAHCVGDSECMWIGTDDPDIVPDLHDGQAALHRGEDDADPAGLGMSVQAACDRACA